MATKLRRWWHNANKRNNGSEKWNSLWGRYASASAARYKAIGDTSQNWFTASAATLQHQLHGRGAETNVNVLQFTSRKPTTSGNGTVPEGWKVLHRWHKCPLPATVCATNLSANDVSTSNDAATAGNVRETLCWTNSSDSSRGACGALSGGSVHGKWGQFSVGSDLFIFLFWVPFCQFLESILTFWRNFFKLGFLQIFLTPFLKLTGIRMLFCKF